MSVGLQTISTSVNVLGDRDQQHHHWPKWLCCVSSGHRGLLYIKGQISDSSLEFGLGYLDPNLYECITKTNRILIFFFF